MRLASGANLPPELIHKILSELSDNPRRRGWLPITSGKDCPPIDKAGLAACSLTCRHWAKTIRPILFAKITVNDAQDLLILSSFFESKVPFEPRLSKCIGALHMNIRDLQATPWIHHLQRVTKHVWPLQIDLYVISDPESSAFDSTLPRGNLPLYGLPRRLPETFHRLHLLQLENLRLRSDVDLFKFVDNFPSLWKCYLRKITFNEGPSIEQRRRRGNPSTSFFYHVEVVQCEDEKPESQLMLVSRLLSYVGRGSRIEQGVWTQLLRAAAALALPDHDVGSIAVMRSAVSFGGYFSDCYPIVLNSTASGARIQAMPGWVIAQDCNLRVPASAQISELTLSFERVPSYEALPWDAFEGTLLELSHVPRITLSLSVGDTGGFKWFADVILQRKVLSRLETAGKLVLKYSTRRGREVTLAQALAYPEERTLGDSTVTLSLAQRFDILVLDKEEERSEYIHKVLTSTTTSSLGLHASSAGRAEGQHEL